jgi:hypothetical protein
MLDTIDTMHDRNETLGVVVGPVCIKGEQAWAHTLSAAGQTLTMPYAGQINLPTVSYMSMDPSTAANRTTLYRTLSRVDITNTARGRIISPEINHSSMQPTLSAN